MHGWMLHATMGSPRPEHEGDRPSAGVFYRDWKGVVQVFGEQRRDESRYVVRALDDLRSVIWSFVGAMHQVVVEEHEETRAAGDQLHRMRLAVESNSTDMIKREALAVVGVMEKLLVQRKERQREQFAQLADKLKNLGRELEDARRESGTDQLTGLANRKAFEEYVTRSIELHSLIGKPACLMMIDADNFKLINDTFGHPAGDTALRQLAHTLSKTFLRRVDFVCRYGGDEFAVILQETAIDNALQLGQKLCRQVHDLRPIDPGEDREPPELSFSIGIAELRIGDDAAAWVKRADAALYSAKRAGRDQVAVSAEE
jgi:diguanylate cyclase (GGDEF)-like protein